MENIAFIFSQKVTNVVNTCANCLLRVRSDGRVVPLFRSRYFNLSVQYLIVIEVSGSEV